MLNFPLFIKCVEKYMSISIEDININKYSKMAVKHHINEIKNLIYELDIIQNKEYHIIRWLF